MRTWLAHGWALKRFFAFHWCVPSEMRDQSQGFCGGGAILQAHYGESLETAFIMAGIRASWPLPCQSYYTPLDIGPWLGSATLHGSFQVISVYYALGCFKSGRAHPEIRIVMPTFCAMTLDGIQFNTGNTALQIQPRYYQIYYNKMYIRYDTRIFHPLYRNIQRHLNVIFTFWSRLLNKLTHICSNEKRFSHTRKV